MTSPFDRFDHPLLAAGGLMGAGWWVLGLLLGMLAPPALGSLSSVMHILGLVTLILVGSLYALSWWGGRLHDWLAREDD